MAVQRITASELGKMLNSAGQPIYVLDDEFTIVFLNRACRRWLGGVADDLMGVRCQYHSEPDATGPKAAAAGLCPPPGVILAKETTATVSAIDEQGRLKRRLARFLPIGSDAEDTIGVVGVLIGEDLAEEPPKADEQRPDELHDRIRRFREKAAGRYRADQLIGDSPAMQLARNQVSLAALSDVSVIVIGPQGSGRNHVAAAIHYGGSQRQAGPVVPLACSILGPDLIKSTVTALSAGGGPFVDRPGKGTLLLNDADQIPPEVQAELAANLAADSFPLRLTATATTSLRELAENGEYSKRLAAMLSTMAIELPPLAERREDIPALSQLFLERCNAEGLAQLGGFSPEALDRMDGYAWPGNVDELAQAVSEAHGRASGPMIEAADLPRKIHLAAEAAAHPPRDEERIVLDEFLAKVERELIERAMKNAKGNKAKAARLLGMTRPRLYRRLLQLGMVEE